MRSRKSLSIILLLLAGCAVGPDYVRPDLSAELPNQYQHLDNEVNIDQDHADLWWQAFNDPAINQLVELALSRNLDIAAADANIRAARAQQNIVSSGLWPQLAAEGRIGRDRFSKNSEIFSNIPVPNPTVDFTDYRAELDASWEIDLFGLTRRQVEASKARLASIEEQRNSVALRVAAEVARNVIDYRAFDARLNNAKALWEDSQHITKLLMLEREAGLISDSELNDANTAEHQAAAAIPPLASAVKASLMALTVLTNQTQEKILAALETDISVVDLPEHIATLGIPSDLLLRRPDLKSAERELAAATADIGVAVAAQYPSLSLVGNIGLDSITPGAFTHLASTYWAAGPQLTLPIFSGGRLTAQVDNREALRDAALANYRQAVLTAFADTETALIRYQREHQRLKQIKLAYASQHRQLTLADQRYHAGETSFIEVLQTRQQLAQLNDQQLASQQALGENLTTLFKALGGSKPQ